MEWILFPCFSFLMYHVIVAQKNYMPIVRVDCWEGVGTEDVRYHSVLVHLTTDEGITGVREVSLAYGTGHFLPVIFTRKYTPIYWH